MGMLFASPSVLRTHYSNSHDPLSVVREATYDLLWDLIQPLATSTEQSNSLSLELMLQRSAEDISLLSQMNDNWDSYGTPAPSAKAIANGLHVHSFLHLVSLIPERVLPSAEAGVSIDLAGFGGRKALIEALNSGETYILLYDAISYCETLMLTEDRRQLEDAMQAMASYLRKGPDRPQDGRAVRRPTF
jgi:hypothetical protein